MPNLGPGINQQNSNRNVGNKEQQQEKEEFTTSNKFENHLLSIRDEHQRMIYPNCHPTYNECLIKKL
jgi:predicted RNA polymerase sigma factor